MMRGTFAYAWHLSIAVLAVGVCSGQVGRAQNPACRQRSLLHSNCGRPRFLPGPTVAESAL
jgi:hypothetical protein